MSRGLGFSKSGGISRGGRRVSTKVPKVTLTPMIDILTILLVFLIKNYSASPAYLTPTQGIQLSQTTSDKVAPNEAVLIIGKDGIFVEGRLIVQFNNGFLNLAQVKNGILPDLQTALSAVAQKTQLIAQSNTQVKFTGTLILQADKELPFESLKPILRTAGVVGYNDIKFAGIFFE